MAYDSRSFGFSFMPSPMVKRLLIANSVILLLTWVIGSSAVFEWFALQPRLGDLVFRPWGPFTYMFLHADLWHLVMNMLMLFFFGPPLEARWGESEFLRFYVICGLGGALLSILFPVNMIVGASAAVLGVSLAFAMNWPDMPVYIWGILPVQAKYLIGFLTLVTIMSASGGASGSGVAHFAHLGGMVAGFLYLKADWRPTKKFKDIRKATTKKRRLAIVPRDESDEEHGQASGKSAGPEDTKLYDQVDAVLDKISAEGMASLTAAELELLDEMSKKHRTN